MQTNNESEPLKLNCPTCKKLVLWTEEYPHRPFCSDRCRLIDLGEWASESHKIAGTPVNTNADEQSDEF
ncbi:MAG: DNA gyrase inhibitor YacG [Moraxellaceae bacterium]|nr:MAG: DNA gyrase inhibitor YacG [Moraxellaceae bacterium]